MSVPKRIVGWERDEAGDWVAALACGHKRHVRHRPPLTTFAWVADQGERTRRIGTLLECGRCDVARSGGAPGDDG